MLSMDLVEHPLTIATQNWKPQPSKSASTGAFPLHCSLAGMWCWHQGTRKCFRGSSAALPLPVLLICISLPGVSANRLTGGAMQLTFRKMAFDYYPFHWAGKENAGWAEWPRRLRADLGPIPACPAARVQRVLGSIPPAGWLLETWIPVT